MRDVANRTDNVEPLDSSPPVPGSNVSRLKSFSGKWKMESEGGSRRPLSLTSIAINNYRGLNERCELVVHAVRTFAPHCKTMHHIFKCGET